MSHPLIWPRKIYCYPIGNTAPICLSQETPPENSANILLLGCGDPRNILFTVFSSGLDAGPFPRVLDFTCCDMEPAVLARNVLLLSLLSDGDHSVRPLIWAIFYDFYIPPTASEVITSQCRKLVSFSHSPSAWRAGPYATSIRFSSSEVLATMHRHWSFYANFSAFPDERKSQIKRTFQTEMQNTRDRLGDGRNLSSTRSAGPLLMQSVKLVPQDYAEYWKTGITNPDLKYHTKAKLINPTFVLSLLGERFNVHYGTHPIGAFHLGPAFAASPPATRATMYESAQRQLQDWGDAFRHCVQAKDVPRVIVRLHVGDALAFCKSLGDPTSFGATYAYAENWKGPAIRIDPDDSIPRIFDVIETSNLADHLGLLNMLSVTIPLLSSDPSSVLYTETLLRGGTDAIKAFNDQLCGDITLMSLLLDLVPSTWFSKFSARSNVHELVLKQLGNSDATQFHERTVWRRPSSAISSCLNASFGTSFNTKEIAKCLHGVYKTMFAHESAAHVVRLLEARKTGSAQQGDFIHYTRGSYVSFLNLVKARLDSQEWDSIMFELSGLIENDTTLMTGMNNYQDLCAQLYLHSVYSMSTLRPRSPLTKTAHETTPFKTWPTLPPVVVVTLVVPRKDLKVLESLNAAVTFESRLVNSQFHNIFTSIQTALGSVRASGPGEAPKLSEDARGWDGTSDLIVWFWAPSWIMGLIPNETKVCFSLMSTPASMQFARYLKPALTVTEAALLDGKRVILSAHPPEIESTTGETERTELRDKLAAMNISNSNTDRRIEVALDSACHGVSTLTARADFTDKKEQDTLSSEAVVSFEQASSHTVLIKFGGVKRTVLFPIPLEGGKIKLRVARRSHYIEIIVSPAGPRTLGGLHLNNFPMILNHDIPSPWNIPRLYLPRLPSVSVSTSSSAKSWLSQHMTFTLSTREYKNMNTTLSPNQDAWQTITDFKESLFSIFKQFTGSDQHRVFGLSDNGDMGIYTALFLTELRMDLTNNTVVLEGYVLPLSYTLIFGLEEAFTKLTKDGVTQIKTVGNEIKAWKQYIPAATERCRTSWSHLPTCEYLKENRIPLSVDVAETPICSCGKGKDTEGMKPWKAFAPHVTKIAISPLFAISHLEEVFNFSKMEKEVKDKCWACGKGKEGGKLMTCSRCKVAQYCSVGCQKGNWKKHKPDCEPAS